jgi:phosphotriesterase-related protein
MNLRTVTGEIPVEAVTLADGHAHAWIKPPPNVMDENAPILDDYDSILAELEDFKQAGGAALVDCQPGGCGRDARMLSHLSETSGLYITAATGFHLKRYYPMESWLWTATQKQAAAFFIEELTVGTTETSGTVRAATIKIGYDGLIEGQTRTLMEAAAEASLQTGAAILVHTEKGQNVEALLSFFADLGVGAGRLYLCHMDKRPDSGLHRELAKAGALLGYDTFLRPKYNPEENVWPLIETMVKDGLADLVALGLDMAAPGLWAHQGGEWGLLALPQLILPRLRAAGMDEATITRLAGQNVARRLVWDTTNH